MAKVQQKSEIIIAFDGLFFGLDKYAPILSSATGSHMGPNSTLTGSHYTCLQRKQ